MVNHSFGIALAFLWNVLINTSLYGADELPGQEFPVEGVGVNIHALNFNPEEIKLLNKSNVKILRMDLAWNSTEINKGQYDFSSYDKLDEITRENNLELMLILDYTNKYYDNQESPHTPTGRLAFCNWVMAAMNHFQGRRVIWEIYNEPNSQFWHPKPNTRDYIDLMINVVELVKKNYPKEYIVAPATSGIPISFINDCISSKILNNLDAFSVHPYRKMEPESILPEFFLVKQLFNLHGITCPIIAGEWGYSSSWKGFTEDLQAKYLPRMILTDLIASSPITIWYDWKDDGIDPNNPEHHFGLIKKGIMTENGLNEYQEKAPFRTLCAITSLLRGQRLIRGTNQNDTYEVVFQSKLSRKYLYALWTTSDVPKLVSLNVITNGSYDIIDQYRIRISKINSIEKHISLKIFDSVQYIEEN